MSRRRLLRPGPAILAGLVAAVVLFSGPLFRGYEAVLLLGDLVGHSLPESLDPRPRHRRKTLAYEVSGRSYVGDLYRPEGTAAAGIIFVPGAAERGKDDPRVIDFAVGLARARFLVLVPDVVALRELRLLPESARDIGDAVQWLLGQRDAVPAERLGLVTTSVAIGPAMLALLDPAVSESVGFFVSIGGYYDLPRTLTYLTTGHYEAHGVSLQHPPNEYGKWVYALSNAVRLDDPAERDAFETLARRKLANPQADVRVELSRLGPAGRAVYDFITNTDPARSDALLRALPPRLKADLRALDLASRDLAPLGASFLLVHGLDDDLIPYGESIGLARTLGASRAELVLVAGIQHVDLVPRLLDTWRLWRAVYALLGERAP